MNVATNTNDKYFLSFCKFKKAITKWYIKNEKNDTEIQAIFAQIVASDVLLVEYAIAYGPNQNPNDKQVPQKARLSSERILRVNTK